MLEEIPSLLGTEGQSVDMTFFGIYQTLRCVSLDLAIAVSETQPADKPMYVHNHRCTRIFNAALIIVAKE
jgi:hypothetical protein